MQNLLSRTFLPYVILAAIAVRNNAFTHLLRYYYAFYISTQSLGEDVIARRLINILSPFLPFPSSLCSPRLNNSIAFSATIKYADYAPDVYSHTSSRPRWNLRSMKPRGRQRKKGGEREGERGWEEKESSYVPAVEEFEYFRKSSRGERARENRSRALTRVSRSDNRRGNGQAEEERTSRALPP